MSLAVGIMCSYHLWTVAHGETTVESQDHEVYRKMAKARNEVRLCVFRTVFISQPTFQDLCQLVRPRVRPLTVETIFSIHNRQYRIRRNLELFFNVGENG
jgi:hypothetical protein